MNSREPIDLLLKRHRAFWDLDEVERPLMSVGIYSPPQRRESFPFVDGSTPQDRDVLAPDRLDAARLVEWVARPRTVNEW